MLQKILLTFLFLPFGLMIFGQNTGGWYTEGTDHAPKQRFKFSVTNTLNTLVKDQLVIIEREDFPFKNIPKMSIGIVDPRLTSREDPTRRELEELGGYLLRKETNGRAIEFQVDDVDEDGIWDEIVFYTDLKPKEERVFCLYIGYYERSQWPHRVHANIGEYTRHLVPFWESEEMGWKLWYPHYVDVHGKRDPMLTAYYEYSNNRSGYYMPFEMGTDIMTVAKTFGGGGLCVFEDSTNLEDPSRAMYLQELDKGPLKDIRYVYTVISNGPLRSIIKAKTFNWNTEKGGVYELTQYYTAYAGKSWCTVDVKFDKFFPQGNKVLFGAGIRKIMEEFKSIHKAGYIISMGKDIEARIPDEDIGDSALVVPWQGIGIVVKQKYNPTYYEMNNYGGNHLLKMPVTKSNRYEYMLIDGWSFGKVNNNEKDFVNYVDSEALYYNNPPEIRYFELENKR